MLPNQRKMRNVFHLVFPGLNIFMPYARRQLCRSRRFDLAKEYKCTFQLANLESLAALKVINYEQNNN